MASSDVTMAYSSSRPGFNPGGMKNATYAALSQSRPLPSGAPPEDLDHTNHDQHLTKLITKKRQEELQRRSKLFDPRTRQLGTDHATLDAQVAAKRDDAERMFAEEAFHARNALVADEVAEVCEQIKQKQRRERQTAAVKYSLDNLAKEQRREWHLSDPRQLKNQSPHDVQPPLAKDDETYQREKKKSDQEFMRSWLQHQLEEKQARKEIEKEEDKLWDRDALAANDLRNLVEHVNVKEQKDEKLQEAEDNKRLAVIHRDRKIAQRRREAQDTLKHSDVLTGNAFDGTDLVRGLDGRLLPTGFKRFGPEEEQGMYHTNLGLCYQKLQRQHEDHELEKEWAAHTNTAAGVLNAIEDEKTRQAQSRRLQLEEENRRLAEEKRLRDLEERRRYKIWEHVQ